MRSLRSDYYLQNIHVVFTNVILLLISDFSVDREDLMLPICQVSPTLAVKTLNSGQCESFLTISLFT